jgi:hypothetical protein
MMHCMSTPTRTYGQDAVTLDHWAAPATAEGSAGALPGVTAVLAETRPWVRLIAVVIFVGLGFLVLGTTVLLLMSGQLPGLGVARGEAILLAVMLVVMSAIYVPPALFLWRYASSIGHLQQGGGQQALEAALTNQKSFWKYLGVVILVMVGLYAVAIVGGMMTGMLGALLKR